MGNNYEPKSEYLPIKNWPEEERPREKLVKFGKEHLTNCELLAIIIGTGCMKDNQSYSALDLASNLISKYKNLKSCSIYQ